MCWQEIYRGNVRMPFDVYAALCRFIIERRGDIEDEIEDLGALRPVLEWMFG